jgi:putative glutamine amidotransferase
MTDPLIGITSRTVYLTRQGKQERSQAIAESVIAAVRHAGGLPVLLPSSLDPESGLAIAGRLDGLVLSGGPDVDPLHFGEEPMPGLGDVDAVRDDLELALCRRSLESGLPVLGVCRGIQVMNVAVGGGIIQDLPVGAEGGVNHDVRAFRDGPGHTVTVAEGTRLRDIVGAASIRVNTSHHQAVGEVPEPLVVCGKAKDGVVEAIEHPGHPFWIGVQWHPHWTYEREAHAAAICRAFVEACRA